MKWVVSRYRIFNCNDAVVQDSVVILNFLLAIKETADKRNGFFVWINILPSFASYLRRHFFTRQPWWHGYAKRCDVIDTKFRYTPPIAIYGAEMEDILVTIPIGTPMNRSIEAQILVFPCSCLELGWKSLSQNYLALRRGCGSHIAYRQQLRQNNNVYVMTQ